MPKADQAADEAVSLSSDDMHLDDFLTQKEASLLAATGNSHRESLAAFGRQKSRANEWKKTPETWAFDFDAFMKDTPR